MATIEKAGVFVKDGKGNVGKLNGLTDNDVAKIQATMTTVDNITDDNGALPDATSTAKGVVLAADANTDVVQPSSGQQYALTTASTPQLVTVKDAQTITGKKSFTGGVDIAKEDLNVNSNAVFASNSVDFIDSNITATFGAVDLSGAQAVQVPTVSDTTDSSSFAASTEFVQNAIDAKAPDLSKYVTTDTEQTITGSKTFSGTVKVKTADTDDSSTAAASTEFVQNAVTSQLPFELNDGYAHRKIFRGYNLLTTGSFSSIADIAIAVYHRDFSDIYIGDYFSVDLGDYGTFATVADIIPSFSSGYEPHLILVTDTDKSFAMNSTATTAGGINSSTMFTSTLPAIDTALCGTESAPFYGMLASCTVYVSSAVDSSVVNPCFPASSDTSSQLTGASSASTYVRGRYAFMLSDYHVFGARLLSTSIYDVDLETLPHQLPLFAFAEDGLDPIFSSDYHWLCNICSSTHYGSFAYGSYNTAYYAATATEKRYFPYAYRFVGKRS